MNFAKVHGAGNDFVLMETSDMEHKWSQVARSVCDRHFGIGADGLLLLSPSEVADFRMRIFNPDGSESNACGNGLRCLVRYALWRGLADPGTQQISIETIAGLRKATLSKEKGGVVEIQVSMGIPKFGAKDIPVEIGDCEGKLVDIKSMINYPTNIGGEELLLNFVSMGNSHAVYFYQHAVSDFPLSELGPQVETHKIFPVKTNFEVANVLNRGRIEARVWERGVGETLACGSGACAVTVVARLHGYVDDRVEVKLPGGILNIEWDGAGEVLLNGPTEIVFTGEWRREV